MPSISLNRKPQKIGGSSSQFGSLASIRTGTKVFDCGNLLANTSATTTVTVTGVTITDTGAAVLVTSSDAAQNASIVLKGYISAADTVTISVINPTALAIDPASATYRVAVLNFI